MKININGQKKQFGITCTLESLLDDLGYTNKKIAVEINGEIVPKSQIGKKLVVDGDRIEIIKAVGGG